MKRKKIKIIPTSDIHFHTHYKFLNKQNDLKLLKMGDYIVGDIYSTKLKTMKKVK